MKKIIALIICLFVFALSVLADGYSWYFKPDKNGRQPQMIPEADFIKEYNVISVGNPDEKKIYLTFDAGYENGNVERILDVLKEKQVSGAFFILPQLALNNKDLLVRMKDEGHLICNHTKSHKDMSKITDYESFSKELITAEDILRTETGIEMDKFYRPPEGRFNENNLKWASELGYTTVFWSLAYADWDNEKQMEQGKALELISSRTHNGCVALLHPTSSTNAAILGSYIDLMRQQGYEFCSLKDFNGESNED